MEIYTIATSDDYDVEANNNIYLKKVSYTFEESNRLLEVAKKYYYIYLVESESTDFNDRYSSSNTYYEQINKSNMIVKDNEFYGVIVYGLEKHQKEFYVCTLDNVEYNNFDGSCYSYVDKTYTLREYNLPQEALDFVHKYHISLNIISYKITDSGEEFDFESNHEYYLTAFDVIMENGKAVGLKHRNHEHRIDVEGRNIVKWQEVKQYGYNFNYYYTSKIVEWSNENE